MSSIFISHSSRDNATAADLTAWLEKNGHRSVFLDFDPAKGIPAGRDWEKELYRNIRSCRAVIAICSQHWIQSPWCFVELTHARALGKHVFPIRIDDTTLDGLVRDTQIVDFRQDRAAALTRLGNGLLAAGLDPTDAFDWNASRPVYPGLLAFQEADAAIFFGRDIEVGDGLDLLNKSHRLGDTSLLLVLGASGSGKSSVLRAGMLPRLRRDTTRWLVLDPFRPRNDPAGELASVLARALGTAQSLESIRQVLLEDTNAAEEHGAVSAVNQEPEDAAPFLQALTSAEAQLPAGMRTQVAAALRALKASAAAAGRPASAGSAPAAVIGAGTRLNALLTSLRRARGADDASVLLIIDQFEELLGHPSDHPCSAFTRLLGASLHPTGSLKLVATMRSDFLGQFQQSPTLAGLRYETLPIGPLSAGDIESVITRPADLKGITLGRDLVQQLVEDARAQDALPLLAFTLRELADRYAADGVIDLDEYMTGLGGMQSAVAKSAEDLVERAALAPGALDGLRRAFLQLVRITADGAYARQFARWKDVPADAQGLLETYVEARLLTSRGEGLERVVEVAHEAIFKSWSRLAGWLTDAAAALQLREQVRDRCPCVGRRRASCRPPLAGRPSRPGARAARERRGVVGAPRARVRSDASITEDEAARERARIARRNRTVVLAAVAIAAIGLSIWARHSAQQARLAQGAADVAARSAEERAREASIAATRARAAQSFAEFQRVNARLQAATAGSFEALALEALAPKYRDQSQRLLSEVGSLEESLVQWKQTVGATKTQSDGVLSLEILQARNNGNSLVLHYGTASAPRLMLFDGGDRGDYSRTLKPRLQALRQERSASAPLPIDLVVSTQTDIQHMGGLIRFLSDLADPTAGVAFAHIETLWSNAFLPPGRAASDAVVKVQPKAALIVDARRLGIPINKPFTKLVTLPEAGVARVHGRDGLAITVLGPSLEYLRAFAKWWIADWRRREERRGDTIAPFASRDDADVTVDAVLNDLTIEGFSDPSLELIPSPQEIARPEVPGGRERSLVNLGSIVLLVELAGKRILLPSDSRADVLMSALAQSGYTHDAQGNVSLDVMAIPHGGSANNVSLEFFQRVKAEHYVFQADGTFDNPKPETLKMIFNARRGDHRPFAIYFTFAPDQLKKDYPVAQLCALLAEERAAGSQVPADHAADRYQFDGHPAAAARPAARSRHRVPQLQGGWRYVSPALSEMRPSADFESAASVLTARLRRHSLKLQPVRRSPGRSSEAPCVSGPPGAVFVSLKDRPRASARGRRRKAPDARCQ